jgi:hypothetical protein
LVRITLDASYVNGTGYTITPANVALTTKIEGLYPMGVPGFQPSVALSGNNAVMRMWKTGAAVSTAFAECATNEAGLNGLVLHALVIGA